MFKTCKEYLKIGIGKYINYSVHNPLFCRVFWILTQLVMAAAYWHGYSEELNNMSRWHCSTTSLCFCHVPFFFLTGLTSFGEFALWRRLWKECLAKILGHEVYSLSPLNEPKKTKHTCWLKLYPIFLWHLLMQANAIIAEHRNMECYASLSSPRLERRITLLCGSQNFFFPCKGFF